MSVVQSGDTGSGSPLPSGTAFTPVGWSANVTFGHSVLVMIECQTAAATISSVTTNFGGTIAQVVPPSGTGPGPRPLYAFTVLNCTGGGKQVTVNTSSGTYTAVCYETTEDTFTTGGTASGTSTSAAITIDPLADGSLVFVAGTASAAITIGFPPSAWTEYAQGAWVFANGRDAGFDVASVAPPPPTPPPPPSGVPNVSAAFLSSIGCTVGARLDPGDAVMLNPAHWNLHAHSQANGSAVTNNPALAKYGQSYYGGATDSYLHCSVANGQGVWMVGDTLPSSGKWIVEASVKMGGPNSTEAWGWGSTWVLGTSGAQELDFMEVVGWSASPSGYGSSTYRNASGTVVNSYYNQSFSLADGAFHTYTLIWDMVNAKQYLVWDGVVRVNALAIAAPSQAMALQVTTGYTAGNANVPSTWTAAADMVIGYYRFWTAT